VSITKAWTHSDLANDYAHAEYVVPVRNQIRTR
jgi:hypothetical protein